ncbi:MAG: CdaR family protein [Firmicutes bacterium]|nr:CdaR family protein [Bacillota bacterium]
MVRKNKTSSTVEQWIFRVVSIIAAILIWVIVTITQNPLDERMFMVSIEQRSLAENLILEKNINQVQIRVQAAASVLRELAQADLAAYVDLAGFNAGQYELEIMVEHPENVSVLTRRPESISVELKDTLTEVFSLEPDIVGEPAPGFKRMEAMVSPAEVKLTGAEDYIRRVAQVYVVADIQDVDVEGYDKSLSVLVKDVEGNDISAMFNIDPKVAKVLIPVLYDKPERVIAVHVPITGQAAMGYQLSIFSSTPAMVRVFGDLNRLQSLYYVDTEAVDISDLQEDSVKMVRLAPANGFTVYPQEVTVSLKIEPIDSAAVIKSIILCQNLDDGYFAEVEQLTLNITVYGPETFIANLDEAGIVPYVDCEGLLGGDYELPINVSLPPNIHLTSISENTVPVTIIAPEEEPEDEPTDDDTSPAEDIII